MSFETRFLRILQIACISTILISSLAIVSVLYVQNSQGIVTLEVKTSNPVATFPKAKLIPVASKNSFKADISNALPSARARRPVVISL